MLDIAGIGRPGWAELDEPLADLVVFAKWFFPTEHDNIDKVSACIEDMLMGFPEIPWGDKQAFLKLQKEFRRNLIPHHADTLEAVRAKWIAQGGVA